MVRNLVKNRNDKGAGATEYLLVLVLIAITVILIFQKFGQNIKSKMTDANSKVESQVTANQ